ncbi:ANKRD17, partial [Symbiodinium sp. CCMP2456]
LLNPRSCGRALAEKMHAGFTDPDLWLLRGLPQAMPEDRLIEELRRMGIALPAFWYLPRSRKRTLFNRGYAFIRFFSDDHADEAVAVLAEPPPQLRGVRIDRSHAISATMVNHANLWRTTAPPVCRVMPYLRGAIDLDLQRRDVAVAPSEQEVPFT